MEEYIIQLHRLLDSAYRILKRFDLGEDAIRTAYSLSNDSRGKASADMHVSFLDSNGDVKEIFYLVQFEDKLDLSSAEMVICKAMAYAHEHYKLKEVDPCE